MQSKHSQPCGLGDIAVSELVLQLDAAAAEERYSVFWCNVGDAGKHAVANFMTDVCQTGKVVALTQLADNRVFLMVKAGVQTGDLNASLYQEQVVPIKTNWNELDDYVALRLLFNSCSQFEGIEDEVPNDTGHLYVISAKGARRDAVESDGRGLPRSKRLKSLSMRIAPLILRFGRLPSAVCLLAGHKVTRKSSKRLRAKWATGYRPWRRWCLPTNKKTSTSCAEPRATSRPNAAI